MYYFNTQTGVSCWEPPPREEYAEPQQQPPQQQQQPQPQQQAEEWLQEAPSKQLHYGDEQVYGQTDAMPAQAQQAHAILAIVGGMQYNRRHAIYITRYTRYNRRRYGDELTSA